ncbi:MAG: efflux RND transporter periplasmic adaptor subunit [Firmicutes bacterium]|nr:efflux RND transporter periplasmic adaptor subunit [Bacillota bacterium]
MKKYIIIILVVLLIGGGLFYYNGTTKGIESETYTVEKGNIKKYVEEIAFVKSRKERVINSNVSGEIDYLNVQVGDYLTKGDIIASLDKEQIDLEIKSTKSKLEALNASFKEAIKTPDKELINKAEARVSSTKINLERAKRKLEDSKKLYNEGAISYDDYKLANENVKLQKEALKIAENELSSLKKGVSKYIREKYQAEIKGIKYQLDILEKSKENYTIKAPIEGTVMERHVKLGSFINPGTPILELGDEKTLYLESDILVSEIDDIKINSKVNIYSEDLDISGYSGKVTKIYPKAFSKMSDLGVEQKRVKIEIVLNEEIPNIKVGYELDIKVVTETKENILIVSEDAVFERNDGEYVFVVDNNKAKLRKIQTGLEGEDEIEIIDGLEKGEKIIVSPDDKLEEGMNIIDS